MTQKILLAFVIASTGFVAQAAQNSSTTILPTRTEHSAKKASADQNTMPAPQVLEVGDNTLGFRALQGGVFNDNTCLLYTSPSPRDRG